MRTPLVLGLNNNSQSYEMTSEITNEVNAYSTKAGLSRGRNDVIDVKLQA